MRLSQHLTFRFALGGKQCLRGRGIPDVPRPGMVRGDGRVYGHTTTAMHGTATPPAPLATLRTYV